MIDLNDQVKSQRYKALNIYVQHCKHAYTIMVMRYLLYPNEQFLNIVFYVNLFQIIFNSFASLFLSCFKREFPKLEYFLVYTLNLFVFLSMLVYSLNTITTYYQHDSFSIFIKIYVLLLLQREIEILVIMVFTSEISNRLVNNCSLSIFALGLICFDMEPTCDQSMQKLSLLLTNILSQGFNVMFNMILFNQIRMQKEIRNFSNQISLLFAISFLVLYAFIITKQDDKNCNNLDYYYKSYTFIAPINFLCYFFILYQEIKYTYQIFKQESLLQQTQTLQGQAFHSSSSKNRYPSKSLKSINSVVNNPMEMSETPSQAPNFGKDANNLDRSGTSQFGTHKNAGNQDGMFHSWANVQNNNPFGQTESVMNNQRNRDSKSNNDVDSFIKPGEESQQQELSYINNPMDSDSIVIQR
ncbi:hypothetical protein pb186bvf_005063 [Paramecium bursaria]